MSRILVSGSINIETTLLVEGFSIDYSLARYPFREIGSSISRVGFNITRALDALFSCFPHYYLKTGDRYSSLSWAVVFASHKIGATGGAQGLLDEAGLDLWLERSSVVIIPGRADEDCDQ